MGTKWRHQDEDGNITEYDDRTLEEAQTEKRFELGLQYQTLIELGMPYQGKFLQIDDASLLYINGKVSQAGFALQGVLTWPSETRWRMLDNTYIDIPTPQDMIALGAASAVFVEGLDNQLWRAQDEIKNKQTKEEVDAITL